MERIQSLFQSPRSNGVNPDDPGLLHKAHASGTALDAARRLRHGHHPADWHLNGSSDRAQDVWRHQLRRQHGVRVSTGDVAAGKLYRNVMAFDAASKPMPDDSQILLSNITANPDGSPCFTLSDVAAA
jgi:hypothetical protein